VNFRIFFAVAHHRDAIIVHY